MFRFVLPFQIYIYTVLFFVFFYAFNEFKSGLPASYEYGQYLGVDSWRYMLFSYGESSFYQVFEDIFLLDGRGMFLYSNSFLYLTGWLSNEYFGSGYVFVYLLNLFFYLHSIYLLRAISDYYGLNFYIVLSVFLMNPLVFHAIFSLNKEIVGVWVLLLGFLFLLKGKGVGFVLLVVFSVFIKSFFSIFLLAFFVVYRLRITPFVFLILVSLFLPVYFGFFGVSSIGGSLEYLSQASYVFSQKSYYFMSLAESFMKVPFGYCISFLIVFAINLLSPLYSIGFNVLHFFSIGGWFSIALLISSLSFTFLLFSLILFGGKQGIWFSMFKREKFDPLLSYMFVFFILVSMLPISQHRYLLPIYPILCIAFVRFFQNVSWRFNTRL